ncbi:FAD-dependent oxidoreductase [Terrisporobacter mayombei]|uniref:Ferredoxin--NADP reductase n=1 Tax=Terrisporobacter mayombei TaxID=1541 RepID=A0ABY9Q5W5_9FIRM|nr:FAD-dependent oxidoreductase [Terrisporobacter mayombei]MCC3870054.1 FAD-dependent oxidoreductase [Terrisporobacter mayombei]WMT82450.1 Ferredoxin--NADP reductase [Terrisporobacter mayombei]
MEAYELIIVGGGAAGMLCAIEAKKSGIKSVLLIEKDNILGGALCLGNYNISNELKITGKFYRTYLIEEYERYNIETKLNTMVLKIEENNEVLCTSPANGIEKIKGEKVILANGAKEGSRKAVAMVGNRCAGIYTVGMAKKIFAMDNMIPGRKILIDGWNTLYMIEKELKRSNIEVVGIISDKEEINTYGLTKNIYYNYEILNIEGKGRVEKVLLSNDDDEIEVECDSILFAKQQLSDGLVAMRSGIKLNPETTGPEINDEYMTSKEKVYACGNGIYIHDYIEEIEIESVLLIEEIINN